MCIKDAIVSRRREIRQRVFHQRLRHRLPEVDVAAEDDLPLADRQDAEDRRRLGLAGVLLLVVVQIQEVLFREPAEKLGVGRMGGEAAAA
jgi:hypothetical protein